MNSNGRYEQTPLMYNTPIKNISANFDAPHNVADLSGNKTQNKNVHKSCRPRRLSNETNNSGDTTSTNSYENKAKDEETEDYASLLYKKPKRNFNSKEERLEFVRSFIAKEKTELCKNWQEYGKCKFGDKCSFAHGAHELRVRTDMPPSFKSRQCRQFNEHSVCPYGTRCQFIHIPLSPEKQQNVCYTKTLSENLSFVQARINCLENGNAQLESSANLCYINAYEKRRLSTFSQLAEGKSILPKKEPVAN